MTRLGLALLGVLMPLLLLEAGARLCARPVSGPVEVLNGGVPGQTSAESLMELACRVLGHESEVIVMYHAINDFRPR